MNRMKKQEFTLYIIVNSKSQRAWNGLLCLNVEYEEALTHLLRLRELYQKNPKAFPDMRTKLLDAERRTRQLEELLTGYFDLIVVLPEE